ncbi:MAG: carbohydrate ABC transporter permease [Candidatus Muiribacteriaceae bacterium]
MKDFVKRYWLEIIMILPLFLYILGFTVLPILSNLKNSFIDQRFGRKYDILISNIEDIRYDMRTTDDDVAYAEYEKELEEAQSELKQLENSEYAGFTLDNYRKLLDNADFRKGAGNTVAITIIGLIIQFVCAMTIAILLSKKFRGKGFFRTVVLTPLGIPTIVSATIMTYIFDTSGYLNAFLYKIGLIENVGIDWAQGGILSILMVVFADTWKVLPLMVLLFIAGLESIPASVHEACAIDGSKSWYKFFTIILPLMKPHITIALILRAIDAFRIFELPLILAGTSTTPVISTYTYSEYTRQNYNISAASGTVLTLIIVIFVFTYLYVVEREKEVEDNE